MTRTKAAAVVLLLVAAVASVACSAGHDARDAREDDARHHRERNQQGRELYRISCASCHGLDARGNGPVAQFLTVPVPDLTRIAARRGGAFPDEEIYRIVDGQSALELRSHGSRQMPIWGYEFFGDDPDDEIAHRQASEKIDRLVAYLRTLQRVD